MTEKSDAAANIRSEYSELSRYLAEVVKFRFVILSFYVGGSALLIAQATSKWQYLFLTVLSLFLWLAELRNRTLYTQLGMRGVWIEKNEWHYKGGRGYFTEMFFGLHSHKDSPPLVITVIGKRIDMSGKIYRKISHSLAIDLIYLLISVSSLIAFADKSVCKNGSPSSHLMCTWLAP